ncbi:MAG: hypothetical protein OXI96_07455 [Acidimicrobiaceae bacterium]|nr:hypothetical protein [Acidimicrobiaceae bacterium]
MTTNDSNNPGIAGNAKDRTKHRRDPAARSTPLNISSPEILNDLLGVSNGNVNNEHQHREDPINSDSLEVLRHEVLRLRDHLIGLAPRNEILEDRIQELENQLEEQAIIVNEYDRLVRSVIVRIARRLRLL